MTSAFDVTNPISDPAAAGDSHGGSGVPGLILVIGLLLTFAVGWQLHRSVEARDSDRFASEADLATDRVRDRLNTNLALLRGGAAFYSAIGDAKRDLFRAYVRRLKLRTMYPGIQGIGWSSRIVASGLSSAIESVRRDGGEGFSLWPGGDRDEYFPVVLIEPLDRRNEAAIGFDLASEPVRFEAMQRARDTGLPSASGRVTLVQQGDNERQLGFLVFVPVFAGGEVPESVPARRSNLAGFVFSPLRADDLLSGLFGDDRRPKLQVEIFDGLELDADRLLHRSAGGAESGELSAGRFSTERVIDVSGRPWKLLFRSLPAFESGSARRVVPIVLAIGVLVSVLVAGVALAQTRARADSAAMAETLRASRDQLRGQQEWLQVTLSSIGDAVIVTDSAGTVSFMNAAAEALSGWRRDEARGRALEEVFTIVDETTRRTAESPAQRVMQAGIRSAPAGQTILIGKDGREWPIEDTAAPIRGGNGEMLGVVILFKDIGARKIAERQQRLFVELNDAVRPFERPEDVMWALATTVGRHFGVSRCSYGEIDAEQRQSTILRDFASGVRSIVGSYLLDDFGVEVMRELKAGRTLVISDVRADPRLSLQDADAFAALETRAVLVVPIVKAARLVGIFSLHHHEPRIWGPDDVTLMEQIAERIRLAIDQARSESALRESEERYRTIFESVGDAVLIYSPERSILAANPAASRMYRRPPDEILMLSPPELLHPDSRQVFDSFFQALDRGEVFHGEALALRSDGSSFDVEIVGAAFTQGGKKLSFSSVRDITARKQVEDSLRESARRKDEFLAMLGHELRNPLAPIQNAAQILRLRGDDEQVVARMREMIERNIRHLARIVDEILDVSRINQGKVTLRGEPLDLVRLVEALGADQSGAFAATGLTLSIQLPQTPVWITADPTRLTQVFGNLLENARKFTDRGGRVTIRLTDDPVHQVAQVRISDTGVGIEPQVLSHLFEPFSQADRSLDRASGGLGLGLAVARGLIELHGGTVRAESPGLGRGAEFIVTLPRTSRPVSLDSSEVIPTAVRKGLRILIVEDNHDTADSLRLLLELLGYEVTVAYSGPDGLEAAKREPPDIVLCDIGLPGMDGFQVAAAIRGAPRTSAARLIAVTGYGSDEDRDRAREAGFDRHLTKPIDPEALVRVIGAV